MKTITTKQKREITFVSVLLGLLLISNPLTEQFIGASIDWAFAQLVMYGMWINLVSWGMLTLYGIVKYKRATRVKGTNKRDEVK